MYQRDTISAISTPLGEGGIGIVRISGDKAEEIVLRIFRGKRSGGMQSHRFYYGEICDPEDAPRTHIRERTLPKFNAMADISLSERSWSWSCDAAPDRPSLENSQNAHF